MRARSVVVATGGLSIPKIGATDLGYRLAQQFNVPLVERRPGLVPLTFDGAGWQPYAHLPARPLRVTLSPGNKTERMPLVEALLFTPPARRARRVRSPAQGSAVKPVVEPSKVIPSLKRFSSGPIRPLTVNGRTGRRQAPVVLTRTWG